MACYHPMTAYKIHGQVNSNGKSIIKFKLKDIGNSPFEEIKLPCGNCVGCRLEKSKEWALRCMHESTLYDYNCFITLTYNEEYFKEKPYSLNKEDFQKFMKRLRKKYKRDKIRYFQCGEYGKENRRPHHHACIFGFNFPDREIWQIREGYKVYRSEILEQLWPYGYSEIGTLTFQSAAYVARYIMKKVNGKNKHKRYVSNIDTETGECEYQEPEYITMSRRPGIGREWYIKNAKNMYEKDFTTFNGQKYKPARYYDKIFEVENPERLEEIKKQRKESLKKHEENNTKERLKKREYIQKRKAERLERSII